MSLPKETLLALHRDMLRTRQVELRIDALYMDDQMKTPVHLYIGQEAIAAGVCAHLTHADPMYTTYRSHGQYLSKGGDLNAMIAELHCKATGCSGGYGGSMHLMDLAVGHYGSSAIVGGILPIAVGTALAAKLRRENTVTTAFFGDGATDEGVFMESLNFAMLRKLPVLFVLENNGWAVCSPTSARKPGENLYHHADPAVLWSDKVDGNDVLAVHAATERAVEHVRSSEGPAFLECETYRVRPHAGSGDDHSLNFRPEAEVRAWEAKDPLRTFQDQLLAEEVLTTERIEEMITEIESEIDAAFAFAESSPLPDETRLLENVYRD